MKLATFKRLGVVGFGAIVNGEVVDMGGRYPDLMSWLAAGKPTVPSDARHLPMTEIELLPPIPKPGKLVCVGLNYKSHLALLNDPTPEVPILFNKPNTSLVGSGQSIVLPHVTKQVD